MESTDESSRPKRPQAPRLPKWAAFCGWIAFAIPFAGRWILDLPFWGGLVVAALPATVYFMALVMHLQALKRHELDDLRWQIGNLEGWVQFRENELRDGQPWFDDQDPSEWEFEQKYSERQAREKLQELKLLLEKKLSVNR